MPAALPDRSGETLCKNSWFAKNLNSARCWRCSSRCGIAALCARHPLLIDPGVKTDPLILFKQFAEVVRAEIDMRRHILQTQLIGEMRVDIAQRLLHFAIVRRGRPAGLRRVVLRRVIFDNHKVELFFRQFSTISFSRSAEAITRE